MLILITSLSMRNPSLACEAVPHRILAVFPAAIMLKPVNDSAAFLVAAHHIQAYARWCQVLELNQQANRPRHDPDCRSLSALIRPPSY